MTRALAVPVARTLPWRTLGGAGALGLLLAASPALVASGEATPWQTLTLLRAAALAGALGLAFLLDDPARHPTTPVPVGRARRQALRLALVAPPAALWWTAVLLVTPEHGRPPAGAVTVEAAAIGALTLACAAAAVRWSEGPRPGPAVASALLAVAVLAPPLAPEGWALFATPDDPRWAPAHERWAWLLAAGTAAWALCAPEPVRLRARPRRASRPAGAA
ncbi:ABC transporter [Streptomyces sp. SCSIO 75703]|uniref:ABC transporter n=1 Tax=unclassified Streptomyces TaxID=2593676 RepID=UPI000AB9C8B8|nr:MULTISPECIES: ABC transporter [unclassified Streptomyces]